MAGRQVTMGIDVHAEITIERARPEVAAYVVEPANEPAWMPAIVESDLVTAGPIGVGSRARRVAKFLGRRMEYEPEVTAYEPEGMISMRTDKPFEMVITYRFEDAGAGTRMTARLQGGGGGFYRIAEPLLALAVRRNIEQDLARLKTTLERTATPAM